MKGRMYSQRLGMISDEQFQGAFERFNLGSFNVMVCVGGMRVGRFAIGLDSISHLMSFYKK
jgi:hypothetical protein